MYMYMEGLNGDRHQESGQGKQGHPPTNPELRRVSISWYRDDDVHVISG